MSTSDFSRERPTNVSLVVPVGPDSLELPRCLASLRALDPSPLEIVVVCDGAGEAAEQAARDSGAGVLRLNGPFGPARARNEGARAARGAILLFLDSDVEAPPGLVGRVAAAMEAAPDLAALIGSYDDDPADPAFLSQYRNLLHHYVHQTSAREARTFWGACGAIRRDVFLAAAGFDESYRTPSIEDVELGYRLTRAGHRIRLEPTLQVRHLKRWKAWPLLKTDVLRRALPWTRLILREGRLGGDLNLRGSARATSAALLLAMLALPAAAWRGEALLAVPPLLAIAWALNAHFYRFLARRRGVLFALRAVPWHWFYFLYSSVAFAFGTAHYALTSGWRPEPRDRA